jgi:hypothetical protein
LAATPAGATLNTFYKGTEYVEDTEIPATAQFSLEKGRAVLVMKGARMTRILFAEKEGLLRIIDDTDSVYFDMKCEKGTEEDAAMMEDVQKQLAELPADQREMVEKMMGEQMKSMTAPSVAYVWSDAQETIAGYECTRVDVMQKDEKTSEYWASTDDDFTLNGDEKKALKAMHECVSNTLLTAQSAGRGNVFAWDTSRDGFPIVTRHFEGKKKTRELTLDSSNRDAISGTLFEVPKGYKGR